MTTRPTDAEAMPRTGAGAHLFGAVGLHADLMKSRQTLLLLATGVTGYLTAQPQRGSLGEGALMLVSLFAAISGTTALNMVLDRDIDARMERTANRSLPSGVVSPGGAARFGGAFVLLGLVIAFWMDVLFGAVIVVGVLFDLLVYTIWLKRRSPWAILIGGISGGMPILAGRTLAAGRVDVLGLLLAFSVLTWIPVHVVTLAIKYAADYEEAGIPTLPTVNGDQGARVFKAYANVLRTVALVSAGWYLRIPAYGLGLLTLSGTFMLGLSLWSMWRPSPRLNHLLFKFASLDMLVSMILLTLGPVL